MIAILPWRCVLHVRLVRSALTVCSHDIGVIFCLYIMINNAIQIHKCVLHFIYPYTLYVVPLCYLARLVADGAGLHPGRLSRSSPPSPHVGLWRPHQCLHRQRNLSTALEQLLQWHHRLSPSLPLFLLQPHRLRVRRLDNELVRIRMLLRHNSVVYPRRVHL